VRRPAPRFACLRALSKIGDPGPAGGVPNHQLAVDVHLTPLLLELGASVPTRGLFVLESELEAFDERARAWARIHAGLFARPQSG
jgi:FMN reductase